MCEIRLFYKQFRVLGGSACLSAALYPSLARTRSVCESVSVGGSHGWADALLRVGGYG